MLAPRILGTATALVLSAVMLAACAGTPEAPEETQPVATPDETAGGEPDTEPTPEPTAAAEPTCDTLIGASVVADFESLGWTFQESPMYIGGTQVDEGIQCMWADFEGPAGDHGQIFGWAPISETESAAAQEELLTQGWVREDDEAGVYITESPETTISADENGYGMTYYFTEGQVTVADTKQGLLLIEWPNG